MTTADSAGGAAPGRAASRLRAALRRRLGIDPRALAAFRIALGAVLLVDLALRSRNLVAFYTDAGVLPRATLTDAYPLGARFSLHAVSGEAWAVALLFLAAALAAVALAVGHRTRVAVVASLLLLASLQARNPFVLNAGDTLLLQLLGAGLLCPLSARWSVDAVRRRAPDAAAPPSGDGRDRVAGPASALLLTLAVVVYVANAVEKFRGSMWPGGEAVARVFRLTYLHGPLGGLVPEWPALLSAATYGWLALLVASPLLVAAAGRVRAALAGTFVAAHLSMAAALQIGVFPAISATSLLPFFPPFVWDRVERAVAPAADRLRRLAERRTGSAGRPAGPRSLRVLREGVAAAIPVLAAVLLVAVVAWNGMALGAVETPDAVASVSDPTEGGWTMFAPNPPSTDARVSATAATADGDRIDALYGDRVARDRPPSDARAYPTARWRKLLTALANNPDSARVDPLLAHLCDRAGGFAEGGDGAIRSVTVSAVDVDVRDGETRVDELGTRSCSAP
ncbi:HTTM domain-containing protein [Halorubrum ezzemoulense]|uniref:HTTM domain-containing protein n=1 Tax=Halorubrum ezzemoulense TaxID=337243 RepID=UPI00232DF805|nr:HTTM domain-containing protein [Halorubrum ezzemoulense]MDB9279696.1 HTTM domain-containing protein [Halorubrum ezzemoulense]MDB9283349.1 HTTM domain-containing protein [Halorubrum ezzemoulense]